VRNGRVDSGNTRWNKIDFWTVYFMGYKFYDEKNLMCSVSVRFEDVIFKHDLVVVAV